MSVVIQLLFLTALELVQWRKRQIWAQFIIISLAWKRKCWDSFLHWHLHQSSDLILIRWLLVFFGWPQCHGPPKHMVHVAIASCQTFLHSYSWNRFCCSVIEKLPLGHSCKPFNIHYFFLKKGRPWMNTRFRSEFSLCYAMLSHLSRVRLCVTP